MKKVFYICKNKIGKILRMMELNDQTKISVKPSQVFGLIAAIFLVGSMYASLNSRLQAVEERTKAQLEYGREIQFIRESVIRIEGKLDMKQDKYTP